MKQVTHYSIFLMLLFFVACQNPAPSPENPGITPEENQIAKDLIQGAFDNLWGGVDSTKILDYHTEDFVILEQGQVWDNDRIKQYMRGQLANDNRPIRINKMNYLSIDKYGPSIQIAYYNDADFMEGDSLVGQAQWLESALAVPTPNGWRLKMMHSSRVHR